MALKKLPLVLSFVIVLVVLSCVQSSSVEQKQQQQDAGEALRKKLNETLGTQPVRYTPVNSTAPLPYNASTAFNPKGMRQLFNITNKVINFVIDRQAYPRG
ncbi:hypothetical protein QAD02_005926 [Eretmocerus hayati]|uniref:Uncharacterized protein n=1 Tax=Eretmocerus hayati TaxID=131215 RepID=A0ACC2N1U4_9HYME|nr:hypothetical protein QAD02_005926 [Eretmocerus hayati]